jgi:hypothetical protein
MWQDILDQLKATVQIHHNIFWPEMSKAEEYTTLQALFGAAISFDIMIAGQVERLLLSMMKMNSAAPDNDTEPGSGRGSSYDDLYTATRELVEADEMLSPLSMLLFGKNLLSASDRENLEQDLDRLGRVSTTGACMEHSAQGVYH